MIQPTGQFAGRLRYDTLANGRARTLPTWLIVTSDRHVAARIATVLAGEPHVNDSDSQEPTYTVLTDRAELDVLLDGPQAIRLRMLRRHGSTELRSCNGRTQRTPFGTHGPPPGRWTPGLCGRGRW